MKSSLLLLLALTLAATSVEARQWTDSSGQHRREAEFVAREGNAVYFRDTDGNSLRVDFDRLSDADQQFILDSERAETTPAPVVQTKTLGFRRVVNSSTTTATKIAEPPADSDTSLFKLTGWSCCTPWYCHRPCPPPIPHPPAPPLPATGKRIYCGKWSTWHLINVNAKYRGGAGAYLLSQGPNVVCHLVMLDYLPWPPPYWYFKVNSNETSPGFWFWRFGSSVVGSCWYRVEYWNGSAWVLYELCSVKLPV